MWRFARIVLVTLAGVAFLAIATPVVVYAPMVARCTRVAEAWYGETSTAAVRSPTKALRQAMARGLRGWQLAGHASSKLMNDDDCLGADKRTLERHIDVLVLTGWLRVWFADDELAALYFNRVYMGPGIYGWDNAARAYYGRELKQLSDDELECLGRKTRNPSRRSCGERIRG